MMGHILEWLYRDLLGISSISGAYQEIRIAPFRSQQLHHISGHYDSIRGRISVDFIHSNDKIILNVQIPPNSTALVRIPIFTEQSLLYESGQQISYEWIAHNEQLYAIVRIGSGSYSYNVAK